MKKDAKEFFKMMFGIDIQEYSEKVRRNLYALYPEILTAPPEKWKELKRIVDYCEASGKFGILDILRERDTNTITIRSII